MATSPLLRVPRKNTGDVDFGSAIRSTISQTYSEPAERYSEEIATLNRVRQDAVRSTAGSENTALQLLYKYFGQLELLELRFPELKVPFPWNDAFTPAKSISQLSLAYEKASVIFNIAATLSSLASEQNRSSPEGLKRSFNYYRSAAGMFTYINDNFLHAPSTDLGRDLVKILVALMTAQATEVFLERMTEEKRSPGLKSKICAQVAAVYAGLVDEVREHVTKGIFDRSWLVLVQTKAKYFASLAQYNRAVADTAASKHGEGLARLNMAENLAKDAHRLSLTYGTSFYSTSAASAASTLPSDAGTSLQDLCKNHLAVVTELKTTSQKDNDLIYHALVPSETSLPTIEKSTNVAEPITIQEIYATPETQKLVGTDIFIKLVPLSIIESSSLYSEEKAKILRTVGESCELADGELSNGIEHLGLPGSLNKFKGGNVQDAMTDPGSQVKQWAREIRESENTKRVEACIAELIQSRDRAVADLEYSSNELDKEQRECEQARVKFDYLFEQSPSSAHNKNWRNDIRNFRESLGQARNSDDQVLNLWNSVRSDVDVLASGEDSLERFYAEQITKASHESTSSGQSAHSLLDLAVTEDSGGADDGLERRIATIHELLDKLTKIQKERKDVLADLKERVHNDDISQLLILNRKSSNVEPTLFAAELEKFRPHQARIQATIQAQTSTWQALQREHDALVSSKKGREVQGRWAKVDRVKKDLSARFKRAVESYREIKSGVTKGTDFYRELSELGRTIRTEVNQFVASRATERSSMVASAEMKQRLNGSTNNERSSLDQSFNSMSLNGTSSSTRSPPPPSASAYAVPSRPSDYAAPYPSSPSSGHGGYSSPAPPPPPPNRPVSNFGSRFPSTSSTPLLPPKPSVQPSYSQPSPQRQTSTGGLPPPPSQPHYHQYQQSSLPPPPSSLSYTSSTQASRSYAPSSHTPSYSSPPPTHSYASPPPPPPPQHPSYTSYQSESYSQQSPAPTHSFSSGASSYSYHASNNPPPPSPYGQAAQQSSHAQYGQQQQVPQVQYGNAQQPSYQYQQAYPAPPQQQQQQQHPQYQQPRY